MSDKRPVPPSNIAGEIWLRRVSLHTIYFGNIIMNTLNLEAIIKSGRITDLTGLKRFKFNNGLMLLTAIVGWKVTQKDRGIKGRTLHWHWKAYSIRNMVDFELLSDAISTGIYGRVIYMYVKQNQKLLFDYHGVLEVGQRDSVDAEESTDQLLHNIKAHVYYGR